MATKLYVGGLSFETTVSDLEQAFSTFASIVSVRIITDRETGKSRGFAFIEFSDDEESKKFIEDYNGKDFNGRRLEVNVARPQADRPNNSFGGGGNRDNFSPRKRY